MNDTASAPHANTNAKHLTFATSASILTATILIVIKLIAWAMTGSVSLLASLIDSIMDGFASLINLLAVRYSLQPADNEHRFGHGKAEPLAGLVQASFISGSAGFLVLHAIERLQNPHPLQDISIGIVVMVIATALTIGLLMIQRHVIKKTGSTAIKADALHYTGDVLSNVAIIIALALSSFDIGWADSVFALAIASYIFYNAWSIGYESFQQLMDKELPDDEKELIIRTATEHAAVNGVHDLRTRQSGQLKFIQLHLELPDNLSLLDSHIIADEVEESLCNTIPNAEVILHQDPISAVEAIRFKDKI